MKLNKFLVLVACLTTLSLLYVYQQTEIFRLAYLGQKKITLCQELLDKNTVIRYNIARNASLIRIGNKVATSADFQMPDTYRLVKLSRPLEGIKVAQYIPKKETMIARIFGIKTQAQAKTINPSAPFSSVRSARFDAR